MYIQFAVTYSFCEQSQLFRPENKWLYNCLFPISKS